MNFVPPPQVEYFSVASPASNYYYLNAPKGEIYGLDHDMQRFNANNLSVLRPEVPEIPGLYLSGELVLSFVDIEDSCFPFQFQNLLKNSKDHYNRVGWLRKDTSKWLSKAQSTLDASVQIRTQIL